MRDEIDSTELEFFSENGEFNWTKYIKSVKFQTLHLLFIGIGLFLITLGLSGDNFGNQPMPSFLSAIAALTMAASSIFIIIRKEALRPGMKSITGVGAIIAGAFSLFVFGCIGLFFLWDGISLLVQK